MNPIASSSGSTMLMRERLGLKLSQGLVVKILLIILMSLLATSIIKDPLEVHNNMESHSGQIYHPTKHIVSVSAQFTTQTDCIWFTNQTQSYDITLCTAMQGFNSLQAIYSLILGTTLLRHFFYTVNGHMLVTQATRAVTQCCNLYSYSDINANLCTPYSGYY